MILTNITYKQFEGTANSWIVADLALGKCNLIVGKNASGKSRTLRIIYVLSALLSGKQKPHFRSGHYEAIFEHEGTSLEYSLKYTESKVESEKYVVDGKPLLERGGQGIGWIYHEKLKEALEFQTPETELAAVARRDSIQHPFLNLLGDWGAGGRYYAFGETMGRDQVTLLVKDGPPADTGDAASLVALFRKGDKDYPGVFREAVRQDMSAIDYPLDAVGLKAPTSIVVQSPFPTTPQVLYVQESNLPCETEQTDMSAGMFRALAIIIHINYALFASKPSCILIDDIGEGLDFDRSCKLIDVVRRKGQESGGQIIMSTNDRFVMNRIPLEEWSVLLRSGSQVSVRNYENSKQIFDDFKFTGLSNFDFFATDYLEAESEMEAVAP